MGNSSLKKKLQDLGKRKRGLRTNSEYLPQVTNCIFLSSQGSYPATQRSLNLPSIKTNGKVPGFKLFLKTSSGKGMPFLKGALLPDLDPSAGRAAARRLPREPPGAE